MGRVSISFPVWLFLSHLSAVRTRRKKRGRGQSSIAIWERANTAHRSSPKSQIYVFCGLREVQKEELKAGPGCRPSHPHPRLSRATKTQEHQRVYRVSLVLVKGKQPRFSCLISNIKPVVRICWVPSDQKTGSKK